MQIMCFLDLKNFMLVRVEGEQGICRRAVWDNDETAIPQPQLDAQDELANY